MKLKFSELKLDDYKNVSGVYRITCKEHAYVGSSKNLYSRIREHEHDLRYKEHKNDFLQKVYNKYPDDLDVEIIEVCDENIRLEREKYWIDYYKCDMNFQDPLNKTLSDYSKFKVSQSLKKAINEGRRKPHPMYMTPIRCYDIFGTYIKTYDNVLQASKELNIPRRSIEICLAGYKKGIQRDGYRFKYVSSKVPDVEFPAIPEQIGRYFDFYYIDEDGNEQFAFSSVKDVWKFIGNFVVNTQAKKQFTIKPRVKKPRESGKTIYDGNPNPSATEM